MPKPHVPTLVVAVLIVLAVVAVYHVAAGRKG